MQVKIVRSFSKPFLAPFVPGEIVNAPDTEAREWIDAGYARPHVADKAEFASLDAPHLPKKSR